MTAVRPEGRFGGEQPPYDGRPVGDPDAWGVYDPIGPATPPPAAPPAPPTPSAPPASRRRPPNRGPAALRPGTGRRRAPGRPANRPRPPEPKRVVLVRLVGELFITFGAVMLLFVAYQLWWTNVQADASSTAARNQLEQQWSTPSTQPAPSATTKDPGTFAPGQGFAIIHIPKIGLTDPIAESVDTHTVLDHGLVGHYTGTALPGALGNFAVAGHRTTHGQPFRRLAELAPGDLIVVETAQEYYTYQVQGGIPETPPTDVSVLLSVPKGSPFTQPGRYLTMTTCTPEFTARGRLIVFGKMIDERPRSQGQPPALANS